MSLSDEQKATKRKELRSLSAALRKYRPAHERWSNANIGDIIRLFPDDWLEWFLEEYTENEAEPFHAIVRYADPYSDKEYEAVAAKVRWLLNLEEMIDWTINEICWLKWQLWPMKYAKPCKRRYERPARHLEISHA